MVNVQNSKLGEIIQSALMLTGRLKFKDLYQFTITLLDFHLQFTFKSLILFSSDSLAPDPHQGLSSCTLLGNNHSQAPAHCYGG